MSSQPPRERHGNQSDRGGWLLDMDSSSFFKMPSHQQLEVTLQFLEEHKEEIASGMYEKEALWIIIQNLKSLKGHTK